MTLSTEEEAKQRWCPLARASIIMSNGQHSANRFAEGGNHPNCHCIGSACQAWRWAKEPKHFGPEPDRGYCGAFGKP